MTAVEKDIFIEQGATFMWFFQLQHADDSPIDLTLFDMRMQVRNVQQGTLQLEGSVGDGQIIFGVDPEAYDITYATPDPTNGWVMIEFTGAETSLTTKKSSLYDVELIEPADPPEPERIYKVWKGAVTDDPNITQEVGEPVLT